MDFGTRPVQANRTTVVMKPSDIYPDDPPGILDFREAAASADLVFSSDEEPGFTRERLKLDFKYLDRNKKKITDEAVIARIRKLAIPPAYTDVWICSDAAGHIQATARDARGRKQYRYHAKWIELRDSTKYEHMIDFADALPQIRQRVEADMKKPGLPREKVLATIIHLLETTLIRVGNSEYARENKSYGLTTLLNRHVSVEGGGLRFQFKGKSGKTWRLKILDRRVVRIVRACQELPGQHLFQYLDSVGQRQSVSSAEVNQYLRSIAGRPITAKDFRTWAGTVLAAIALSEFEAFDSNAKAKKNLKAAIEKVSAKLGNTPTICRKCYIHPEILNCYLSGTLVDELKQEIASELSEHIGFYSAEEAATLVLLYRRLR